MPRSLLTIAGLDPSGGAGILLDLRVFERLGFRGAAVLTSVTAQNSGEFEKALHLQSGLVAKQYESVSREWDFSGIKTGMIGSLENLATVARILSRHASVPRVIDPVFRASSGAPLLEKRAVAGYLALIKGKATLLTPNLEEASSLTGRRVRTEEDMIAAAREIYGECSIPCLVKGGHLKGEIADVLYDGADFLVFRHARAGNNVHGTGCFLSAAILGFLAGGLDLEKACRRGIGMTGRSIRKAVPGLQGRMVFPVPL
jgi:hydroxymethylpyrimidine/phosphomethylpyrimidine kinase